MAQDSWCCYESRGSCEPSSILQNELQKTNFLLLSLTVVVITSISVKPRQSHVMLHKVKKQVSLRRGGLVYYVVHRRQRIREHGHKQASVDSKIGAGIVSSQYQVRECTFSVGQMRSSNLFSLGNSNCRSISSSPRGYMSPRTYIKRVSFHGLKMERD